MCTILAINLDVDPKKSFDGADMVQEKQVKTSLCQMLNRQPRQTTYGAQNEFIPLPGEYEDLGKLSAQN